MKHLDFIKLTRAVINEPSPELSTYLDAYEAVVNMPQGSLSELRAHFEAMDKLNDLWFRISRNERDIMKQIERSSIT